LPFAPLLARLASGCLHLALHRAAQQAVHHRHQLLLVLGGEWPTAPLPASDLLICTLQLGLGGCELCLQGCATARPGCQKQTSEPLLNSASIDSNARKGWLLHAHT
jgi:hypothetical protein